MTTTTDVNGAQLSGSSGLATIDAERLRLLAESADGLREQDLILYTIGAEVRIGDHEQLGRDNGQPILNVRTRDPKKHLFEVTARLIAKRKDGTEIVEDLLSQDAVFWSTSAIRKFVVLYYAGVWNGRFAEQLLEAFEHSDTAIGLAHSPPSDPSLVDPGHALQVIKSDRGLVQFQPVVEFVAEYLNRKTAAR